MSTKKLQIFGLKGDKGDKGDAGVVKFTVVNELPEVGNDYEMYLVKNVDPTSDSTYDEYIWVDGHWELLGQASVQVDLTDYVKNTDYASASTAGVIKTKAYGELGIEMSSEYICIRAANSSDIDGGDNNYYPITPKQLNYATKKGITKNTIELTEEEQTAAQNWLGGSMVKTVELDENGDYSITIWNAASGVYICPIGTNIIYNRASGSAYKTTQEQVLIVHGKNAAENQLKMGILLDGVFFRIFNAFKEAGSTKTIRLDFVLVSNTSATISGKYSFATQPTMTAELAVDDNSTNIPNTAWVNAAMEKFLSDRGL